MAKDLSIIRYEELRPQGGFRQQDVFFTWGKRSKKVDGMLRLVQMVVKILLTSSGSDFFNPSLGTIIPTLVKKGVSESSAQVIKTDIMVSIQDLERQIVDIQATEAIPDDERLQAIDIRRVEFLPTSTEWIIELTVTSQAGEQVAFDISPFLKGK